MTTLYLFLEAIVLLTVIIVQMKGPKKTRIKKNTTNRPELGKVAVNEAGVLVDYLTAGDHDKLIDRP
jgi:hypothetical protein